MATNWGRVRKLNISTSTSKWHLANARKTLQTLVQNYINLHRLEIPFTLHFELVNKLRLAGGLGLEFNFAKAVDSDYIPLEKHERFIQELPGAFNKTNLIFDIGLGYDWGRFSFDLRYRSPLAGQYPILNPTEEKMVSKILRKDSLN